MASKERIVWTQIGTSKHDCLNAVTEMYWQALQDEVADVICSLQHILELRKAHSETDLSVGDMSSRMSQRMGPPAVSWSPFQQSMDAETLPAFLEKVWSRMVDSQDKDEEYILARAMLGGLGMLDIDEVIEYNEPLMPSQAGPPLFITTRDAETGKVTIQKVLCDVCSLAVRGAAWKCALGCTPQSSPDHRAGEFTVCRKCNSPGKHPGTHLIRSPHAYAIDAALQSSLTPPQFFSLRRQIQESQYVVDAEEDRAAIGSAGVFLFGGMSSLIRHRFPLGNVHSSIMFGPLVFEIGVEDSKGGVRVSTRKSPGFGRTIRPNIAEKILAIDPSRRLFHAKGWKLHRPIQAVIKQVVGGAFSGYHGRLAPLEDMIIQGTVVASRRWRMKPLASPQNNCACLLGHSARIVSAMKFGIDDHVAVYLNRLVDAVYNANTDLVFDRYQNNCQNFCNAMLHYSSFATVLPQAENVQSFRGPNNRAIGLDYLLSFRTRRDLRQALEASRARIGPLSAFLKQLHHPDNVLDYRSIQQNQREAAACAKVLASTCPDSDCTLADHVWTNPAELVSILQLHLLLEKEDYEQEQAKSQFRSEAEWMQQSIQVLKTLDSFTTSAAALALAFQEEHSSEVATCWAPPTSSSVPQDIVFAMLGDRLEFQQVDTGREKRSWRDWWTGRSLDQPDLILPGSFGPNVIPEVFTPTLLVPPQSAITEALLDRTARDGNHVYD
ncbi:hypothetical protein LTR91_022654 [Friedmanniomyces endolithicus]|uniref:PPPDE domain-containing protein n=1 Tax=Friedmanniomyces endolithicus TaxID=329885 RepID=A0AAN6H852_9PEZI|nr:hypothetical protein LTR91_022654 [Friedmanniomyces endolithicus]KAK1023638.1 hypothetical protein LTS16_024718 [Friedmanniomyces endolithicus]